ncbi:MAG: hypothetical protein ABI566_12890 [Pseudolysinimonas sp.]
MPTPHGRAAIPVLVVGGLVAAAAGAVAIIDRVTAARRDRTPAAPGTPQLDARLPIALWPSDGSEPMVEHAPRGWNEMLAALYHRDTVVDDAGRARAVAIAHLARREQDARREVALEAHVLRGSYEPALIAAAWLHPVDRGVRLDDLATFGLTDAALATLRAAAQLDADPDLEAVWRREFGIDVVRPQVTAQIIAETPPDRLGMLWALLLGLAAERVITRQALPNTSRG